MKKMILTAIVMIALGGVLSAQTKPVTRNNGTNINSPAYVDANKNKVCDNFENNTRPYTGRGQQFRRGGGGNGCGAGNRFGRGNGQCRRGGGWRA